MVATVTKFHVRRTTGADFTKDRFGYRFIDKDPYLDTVIKIMDASGLSYSEIAYRSGVSPMTLVRWRFGGTKRPQHLTMEFVLRACGCTIPNPVKSK